MRKESKDKIEVSPTEKAKEHCSRVGDYMRCTKNVELKKMLDKSREDLNSFLAEIETASGLSSDEILDVYVNMSNDPSLANEKINDIIRDVPEEILERGVCRVVEWSRDNLKLDSKKIATLTSAFIILVSINGGRIKLDNLIG